VSIRRFDREHDTDSLGATTETAVLAVATQRPHEPARLKHEGEEKLSLFWRVFGGTTLSIVALVGITIYNNLSTSISELRSELNRVNEARAELVKKEEFNARTQNVWDRVQALQELKVTVTALKEQVAGFGDKKGDFQAVQEKLTLIEQRIRTSEEDHKALMKAELAVAALEQKAAAREAQLKAGEDERKELARQLQDLRERLAKVEGATEVKPMTKGLTAKGN
jgi:DNA repair exonuclease SbcCD ATPase subunit